jgi:GNAT superfamily N-acetyltransferase
MTTILPLSRATLRDAALLIRNLRTAMNGKVVCSVEEVSQVLTEALQHGPYRGFLAYGQAGGLQGYIGVDARFAIYAGGHFLQVTELFVQPEARRKGVAKSLLSSIERMAQWEGGSAIEIGAPDAYKHPGTAAFYENQGYRIVGPRFSKSLK